MFIIQFTNQFASGTAPLIEKSGTNLLFSKHRGNAFSYENSIKCHRYAGMGRSHIETARYGDEITDTIARTATQGVGNVSD